MTDRRLTDLSLSEFLQAVASAAQPVPAGGSVAALTGAVGAALLVLVCDVLERHHPDALTEPRQKAAHLQQRLLGLVDDDAVAFRGFLDTERGSPERQASGRQVAQIPLDIGRACLETCQLVPSIEPHVTGSMRLDVATANNLAQAAARSALDIAQNNLSLVVDPVQRREIASAIQDLRPVEA
jgi:glutamate formiminotransferase/formiminotetrahydrofolate cyclodeaminase